MNKMSNNQKLLKAYFEAVKNGNLAVAMEEAKELFIENTLKSGFYGTHHKITLYPSSEVWISSPMNKREEFDSTYRGETITLATIEGNYENDFEFNYSCIDDLTEEDKEKLFITTVDYLELDLEDEDKEIKDIYDLFSKYEYVVEEKFIDIFKEEYRLLLETHAEANWTTYGEEEIINEIESTIEELIEEVDREERAV